MATAYVLVNCDLGYEAEIIDELKQIDDVKEVHGVYGAYDILAEVKSANIKNLREIITWKIRKLNSIRSTLTLMVTEDQD